MVVAHVIGKGAPELVRFFGESALVREPDVTLFGLERLDPPEQEFLSKSPMRHIDAADIRAKGGGAAARDGLTYVHADSHEFVLHLDTDAIAVDEFPAVNVPGSGGLPLAEVRAGLNEFAKHKNLLGLTVAQYNPDKDTDGSGAKKLVDLLVEALSARLEAPAASAGPATESTADTSEVSSSGSAA
jgi:arginase